MLGFTQMIPNASKLKADSNYMNAMSAVEVENKNYHQSLNFGKNHYYQWIVLDKNQNCQ
jgi:hypothetical protein